MNKIVNCALNEEGTHLCIEDDKNWTKCLKGELCDNIFHIDADKLRDEGFDPAELAAHIRRHPQIGVNIIIE